MSWVDRPAVDKDLQDRVLVVLASELARRLQKHGPGAYVGPHEALGVIAEEYDEFKDAVRANDSAHVCAELYDIAVACVFAIASLNQRMRYEMEEGP